MNTKDTKLSTQDVRTLHQLLQITAIRGIFLIRDEIDILLPNQTKVEKYFEGYLNFDSRSIILKVDPNKRSLVSISLDDHYSFKDNSKNYENYVDWHYSTQFILLEQIFGNRTLLYKLVDAMKKRYEGLSEGQAVAVLKKYVPPFRDDISTGMSSTTRTQIHRLRSKLEKYKRLVDSFYPLLVMENITLEEIAEQMAPHQKYTQSPYFVDDYETVNYDVNRIGDIVKEVPSSKPLKHAQIQSRDAITAEIEETRKRLIAHGFDPHQSKDD